MTDKKIPMLVICGATASGKTRLAVEAAKEFGGEIISADSMQVYKDFSVITAKPTQEEMGGIKHHLIDFLTLDKSFSAAEYVKLAAKCAEDIFFAGKLPIVCGGTGLYISSLINGIRFGGVGADPGLREELRAFAVSCGNHALWERLLKLDPEAAAQINENDLKRVIRAVEVCESGQTAFSVQKRNAVSAEPPYNTLIIQIGFRDRADLYERINDRVDAMLRSGMVEEALRIYKNSDPATAYQAIGYKELIPYFENKRSLEECVEIIKRQTRRYAKRQLTWFRKMDNIHIIYAEKTDDYKIFFENVRKTIVKSEILCYNR